MRVPLISANPKVYLTNRTPPYTGTVFFWHGICLFALCLLLGDTEHANAIEQEDAATVHRDIALDDDTDLSISVYPADGPYRILWIPAYATPVSTVNAVSAQLNALGVEVWYADILEARFLPKNASSIYKIKEKDIISVIRVAQNNTEPARKLFVFAESRSTIPVLLALRQLQQSTNGLQQFGGVILNSPYFYVETPNPGNPAQLMPIVGATNLPVFIFQPKDSPRYWQLQESVPALEKMGSDVFQQVMPGIRGRFLFRPDANKDEEAVSNIFGRLVMQAIKYLETVNHKGRRAASGKIEVIRDAGEKKDRLLQNYAGKPDPPALILKNLNGREINLAQFKHHVVLVNFWASWCPPCVDEMPSLQRLSKQMPENLFVILGVNIAEDRQTILKFLDEKVSVEFPILLDSDGTYMRQWNVMAFPTSFVIDKHGKIRFALFGSIDWDSPEIIKTIQPLLIE